MVYYVPMGLFDRFRATQPDNTVDVAAALSPYNAQQLVGGILFGKMVDPKRCLVIMMT